MNPIETETVDPQSSTFDQGGVLLDRPSGVTCPACGDGLMIGEIELCKFAGCPKCKGMLFQQQVFGVLIQHLRATSPLPPSTPKPLDVNELNVRRACPSCEGVLETHAYSGPGNAVIDTCFPCRIIWLDQGELTKLVHAPGRR